MVKAIPVRDNRVVTIYFMRYRGVNMITVWGNTMSDTANRTI